MKVLVTGGAGYLGSVLVPKLIEVGSEVVVLEALHYGSDGLKGVGGDITLIEGDVRDFQDEWLDGVDGVVHLAGLSNDPTSNFNYHASMQINTMGTMKVAQACKRVGVPRLIFASSASVYYTDQGSVDDPIMDEAAPVAPTSAYSRSKWLAECELRRLADQDFCPVALRMGTLFGYSRKMRLDLIINTMVRDAILKGRLTVHQGGEMYRPLTHVDDAADAYITLLNSPSLNVVAGQAVNLVHKNYFVVSVANHVKYVLDTKLNVKVEVDVTPRDSNAPSRSYRMDGKKAQSLLGIKPELGISDAIVELYNKLLPEKADLRNPKYENMAALTNAINSGEIDKDSLRRRNLCELQLSEPVAS